MIDHLQLMTFVGGAQIDGKSLPLKFCQDIRELTRDGVKPMGTLLSQLVPGAAAQLASTEGTLHKSGFRFGASSEKELVGVNFDLVTVTRLALQRSKQDFIVFDGIRSLAEQQRHVQNGTSKTMKSKHLDGLAVDLVPWINGKPVWDWNGCYLIAMAMDEAATELGLAHRITWGGAWDRTLAQFGGDSKAYMNEVIAYRQRHPGPDFIDGPHFEIKG